jgi:hypothetical protein
MKTNEPWFSDKHWSIHFLLVIVLLVPILFIDGGWWAFGPLLLIFIWALWKFYLGK